MCGILPEDEGGGARKYISNQILKYHSRETPAGWGGGGSGWCEAEEARQNKIR